MLLFASRSSDCNKDGVRGDADSGVEDTKTTGKSHTIAQLRNGSSDRGESLAFESLLLQRGWYCSDRLRGLSKVEPDVSEESLDRLPKRGSRERMLSPMCQPHFVFLSDRLPRLAERSLALMEKLEKLLILFAGAGGKQGRRR